MKLTLFPSILFLCVTSTAFASSATYDVSIDTSTLSGAMGSLDFNFNPGPLIPQAASLQILNFGGTGTVTGTPLVTGDVTGGSLPATLTFDNGAAFNDYFQMFTFGNTITFSLSLSGPALNSPGGLSGSTFAFSMFSDAAGSMPVLTSDMANGFAFTVDVNTDASTTLNRFSPETTITSAGGGPSSVAPEPANLTLVGIAGVAFLIIRRRVANRSVGHAVSRSI